MTDEPNKNGEEGDQQEDDVFLKKIESSMLSQVKLQGIEGIRKVRPAGAGPPAGCTTRFLLPACPRQCLLRIGGRAGPPFCATCLLCR